MRWIIVLLFVITPFVGHAQDVALDITEVMKAEVIDVVSQEEAFVPGTDVPVLYQTLEVRVLDGSRADSVLVVENDRFTLKAGEVFYLRYTRDSIAGAEYFTILEPYRIPQLAFLTFAFVLLAVALGGLQGARGLLALILSVACIGYVLLPAMLAGYSPILVSILVASLVVVLGSYITHGFNRMTSVAVSGMIITIACTGALSYIAILWTRMTGGASEASTYLLFNTRGEIDLVGLYLAGILIGLLGVLYDAAIGQAVAVEELKRADKSASWLTVYRQAIRIGREHIGALVNTLAIAYVGASLPLLLFFFSAETTSLLEIVNRELFSSEILRILVSSIGVMCVVPITTLLAVRFLEGDPNGHKGHTH